MFGDDQADFRNIALGKAEVQAHLSNYMAHRGTCEVRHATVMAAHAEGTWITVSDTNELTFLAKDAMQQLWICCEVHRASEAEALGKSVPCHCDHGRGPEHIRQGRATSLSCDAVRETEEGHCPHHGRN